MTNYLSPEIIPYNATVAVLGPESSFSKKAAMQLLTKRGDVQIELCRTMDDVRKKITTEVFGLLPRVNYSSGNETRNVSALLRKNWRIRAETGLAVEMCIGGIHGAELKDATHIHSKDVAIAQCEEVLENECPNATWVNEESTGIGVEVVATHQSPERFAIASEMSILRANLAVILKGASNCEQDGEPNITQFTLASVAKEHERNFDEAKPLHGMVITPENKPGVLEQVLHIIANNGMDLEDLHSIPYQKGHFRFLTIMRKHAPTASINQLQQDIESSIKPNSAHPLIKPLGSWGNI